LFSADSEQPSGTVVNSAQTAEGCICLVTATESGVAEGLHIAGSDIPLAIQSLPYPMPD
jgi:hypothetical protein